MSELIDHDFDNDGDEDNHDHCWRHVTSFGNGDCGQPRARHRQAEKAQDFGEPWEAGGEAALDRDGDLVDLRGIFLARSVATVNACAGAADPQPGELARLRKAIAEAASEINCAGPVAARIRVLKQEHADSLRKAEADRDVAESRRSQTFHDLRERATRAEASLAQALLVLKALDVQLDHANEFPKAEAIAAFEALRKDGLLEG